LPGAAVPARDHLGSVSLATDQQGNLLSQARHTPYGEVRWPENPDMPTDFGYTGQRSDSYINLLDYNARYYSARLGRFVSADSVIPNPGKAVSLDRFAYADANPLRYRDPSGHEICTDDGNCNAYSISAEAYRFGIKFTGTWSDAQKLIILAGVGAVADKLGSVLRTSSARAFRSVYGIGADKGSFFNFEMGNCEECNGAGAYTHGSRHVEFDNEDPFTDETLSYGGVRSSALAAAMNIHTVIHELGHAFNDRLSQIPEGEVPSDLYGVEGFAAEPDGGRGLWIPNYQTANGSEAFANMFLGWVYGQWGNNQMGNDRALFMTQMDGIFGWVWEAAGR
jgi:RHS repeat-associated protein